MPPKPKAAQPDASIRVPRDLVEQTVQILLASQAASVYLLLKRWELAAPDIFVYRAPGDEAQ